MRLKYLWVRWYYIWDLHQTKAAGDYGGDKVSGVDRGKHDGRLAILLEIDDRYLEVHFTILSTLLI